MLSQSQQWLLFSGALLGFLGVALGAFGAHALKQRLAAEMLAVFEVGVRYHMYHALAIVLAVILSTFIPGQWMTLSGWFFLVGVVIFSGSLYILALTGIKAWGAVTPIGGVMLLIGWLCLAVASMRSLLNW